MSADTERDSRAWFATSSFWQTLAALIATLLYARTVGFDWAFDDHMEIVRNTYVQSLGHLPSVLNRTHWTGSGMETYLYRPLVLITYMLNHAVSGLDAWSYHLVNVLLHAGASVLVFRVGRLWGLTVLAAGVGAVLFAAHPVHVEVVANVAGRKDLLAAVFLLGMVLSHRRAVREGGWRWVVPVGLFGCAMLSKEVGIVGLLLVAAQDIHLERDRKAFFDRPGVIGAYVAYMCTLATFLVVRLWVTGAMGVPETFVYDNPLVEAAALARLATAFAVVGKGFALLVVPATLSPDYSFDAISVVESAGDVRVWTTLIGLGLMAWALRADSRRPSPPRGRASVLPMAVAWYSITLLPTSNLLVTVGTIFGERLLYLPSVAFCLAAGAGISWISTRRPRLAVAATATLMTAFAVQTVRYSGAWSDDIKLFEWATASVPGSTKAHHKLGEEYLRAGRLGDALRSLDRALKIAPDNNFAATTAAQAKRSAVERFARSGASGSAPDDPDVLYVLGQSSMKQGDEAGAVAHWLAAVALDPAHAESLGDLGAWRLVRNDTVAATEYLRRALDADPGLASAWFNLAGVWLAQQRTTEAAEALRSFLGAAGSRYPDQVNWANETLRRMDSGGEPGG